jgi:uncharacterized protein (TIGR00255 family)
VDGTDLRDVTLASLRAQIGLVTQEVVLFDETVRRNVAYGTPDMPDARIREALEAAKALAFVDALPEGLDAHVGEGGARLSGGQRQRLAIARALLKDPPILVLDEATSALDAESERAVQQALERLMAGRTTLVIAHRLSTVRRADQLAVIDAGRIVERGSHADLLASGGLYRRLHDLQVFDAEDGGGGASRHEVHDRVRQGRGHAAGRHRGEHRRQGREPPLPRRLAQAARRVRLGRIRDPEGGREGRGARTRRRADPDDETLECGGNGPDRHGRGGAKYAREWREDSSNKGLPGELSPRDLLSLPGVVRQEEAAPGPKAPSKKSSFSLVDEALQDFDAARAREGAALSLTFKEILGRIDMGVASLDAARAGISERIAASLRERIEKLAAGIPLDEGRLAQEVAQLADRADITEEIDRLKTHLAEARRLLAADGAIGRRLDHLAQELHREVNTSGSKVREAGATKLVLDLKSELEAFKEQVQNVE